MLFEIFAAILGAAVGSILSAWLLSHSERKAVLRSSYANVFDAAYSLIGNKSKENFSRFVIAAESAAFVCSKESIAKMGELFDALDASSEDAALERLEQLRVLAHKDLGTQLYK